MSTQSPDLSQLPIEEQKDHLFEMTVMVLQLSDQDPRRANPIITNTLTFLRDQISNAVMNQPLPSEQIH